VDSVKKGYVVVYGSQEVAINKIYTVESLANSRCNELVKKGFSAWVMEMEIVDKEDIDLSFELAKIIQANENMTVDEFFDKFEVSTSERNDFGMVAIMKGAYAYLDEWDKESKIK
jgi:hypothetical protein